MPSLLHDAPERAEDSDPWSTSGQAAAPSGTGAERAMVTAEDIERWFAQRHAEAAPAIDASFAELYQLQMPWLVSYCRGLTRNTSVDGEDVAAIVIETAWQHRFGISHHPDAFRGWLRTTARREAMRQLRHYMLQILCDYDELLEVAGWSEGADGTVQDSEWCRTVMAELSVPMRSVLVLRSFGYRDKEIAEILKIPESRVRVTALRAREKAIQVVMAQRREDSSA